jgi:hypothetical protein
MEDLIARNSRLSELYNSGKLDAGIIIRLSRFPRDASEQLKVPYAMEWASKSLG